MQSPASTARPTVPVSIGSHLAFLLGSALCMLLLFALARAGLLAYNHVMIGQRAPKYWK